MNASFVSALTAAREAAAAQHYTKGALYLVATPIGNLADISLRALHVLQLADRIACEDTRHSQALLRSYGIDKPLLAVHEHNEAEAAVRVIAHLQAGERVAFISDAGTPAVSDPGARLVQAVRAAGLSCSPLPGPSSVTAALSVAGVSASAGFAAGGFVFAGFLPPKATEREAAVQLLGQEARAVVRAAKFAPLGERGAGGALPHLEYRSFPTAEANAAVNDATMMIVQFESAEALDKADEIAAVDGVDMVLLGINDLLSSLGFAGQHENPKVREAYARTIAACRKHGKHVGVGGLSTKPKLAAEFIAMGARMVSTGTDIQFLQAAMNEKAAQVHQMVKG